MSLKASAWVKKGRCPAPGKMMQTRIRQVLLEKLRLGRVDDAVLLPLDNGHRAWEVPQQTAQVLIPEIIQPLGQKSQMGRVGGEIAARRGLVSKRFFPGSQTGGQKIRQDPGRIASQT